MGQANSLEARIVATRGMQFAAITSGKFRRSHADGPWAKVLNLSTIGPNVRDLARVVWGVGGSLRVLRRFKPDVVFLKGGHVCLPVGLAARLLHIPYVIHESDIEPGLANRILSRWATKIAVGFPAKTYHDFDPNRLVFTGNPVRPEVLKAHRLEGLAKFKLQSNVPVLLVWGGSQGAIAINDALVAALPLLLPVCQIIHLTGEYDFSRVKFELSRRKELPHRERYHAYAYLQAELPMALAAADVAVGRGGANTIAELAALAKPTILIPNYLMAGHQVENARVLSRQGAVRVIDERRLTPQLLAGEVQRILGSEEEQRRLSDGIRRLAKADAGLELARLILSVGRVGESTETEQ